MMDELQLLLKACGPVLYRSNAFRMLALPVDASARDVNRQRDKVLMAQRLGGDVAGGAGPLALKPAPAAEEIRLAVEAVHEPATRLVQELFWFWPSEPGQAAKDPALKALHDGDTDDAQYLWLDAARQQNGSANVARHNLAVLAHFSACECEYQYQTNPQTAPPDRKAANEYWSRAFRHWSLLTKEGRFWDRLAQRIRSLEDPQLTADMAEKIRRALGPALLSINADFAVKAVEAGNLTEAGRHVALIKQSGFAAEAIDQALRRAAEPIVQRLNSISQKAKKASQDNPGQALELCKNLMQETNQHLSIIDQFFAPGHLTYESAHDEVALVALQCQIAYGNQSKDWQTCLELLRQIRALAGGASTKTRIEENTGIIQENLLDGMCLAAERDSKADPARADQTVKKLLADAQSLLALFPPGHPRYEMVRDMVVGCALACEVMHGNQTKDWQTSVELLQKIQDIAVSVLARQRVQDNLLIVRENLIVQRCQAADACIKSQPAACNSMVEQLLRENLPLLAAFPLGYARLQELTDHVALCALDCAIVFGNTMRDWGTTMLLMQRIQQMAVSPAVRNKLTSNISIVSSNQRQAGYYYTPPSPRTTYPPGSPLPYAPKGMPMLVIAGVALVAWFLVRMAFISYPTGLMAVIGMAFIWVKSLPDGQGKSIKPATLLAAFGGAAGIVLLMVVMHMLAYGSAAVVLMVAGLAWLKLSQADLRKLSIAFAGLAGVVVLLAAMHWISIGVCLTALAVSAYVWLESASFNNVVEALRGTPKTAPPVAPAVPPAPAAAGSQAPGEIPSYMNQAILATCLCAPAGIVALLFASKVSARLRMGDTRGAMDASDQAKLWSGIAVGLGVFVLVLMFLWRIL